MKAYYAQGVDDDWGMLVHGKTRGQAKWNFIKYNPAGEDAGEFKDVRLYRKPKLDNKAFTPENLDLAGFYYLDEAGDNVPNYEAVNDCCCSVCMPKLYKE